MAQSGNFEGQRVLLIDRAAKDSNDRTWCFWEEGGGFFDGIVHRSWAKAWFHDDGFSKLLDLSPYRYKMIRGIDFYDHCRRVLSDHPQFMFRHAGIDRLENGPDLVRVHADGATLTAPYVYSSLMPDMASAQPRYHHLLQHFKGWVIETEKPSFNPAEATLMDFRPSQQHGTTFVYVMPFTEHRALVEYTLFSPSLLDDARYEEGLTRYVGSVLGIDAYTVVEKEFGVIPMTDRPFPARSGRILHIGTAGGNTKASTGYTFQFIQKQAAAIVHSLEKTGDPFRIPFKQGRRFSWYDSVLLHILTHHKLEGHDVFRMLFQRNEPSSIFRFLDNDSTIPGEAKLMNTLPMLPFLKAGLRELPKMF